MVKETGDFEKLLIRLYRGDKEKLEEYYPKAGYNKIVRRLVREHLSKLDAKFEQRTGARGLGTTTLNMENLDD